MEKNLGALENDFADRPLHRADLHPEPMAQFAAWFADAQQKGVAKPHAMSLASGGAKTIGLRTVLLKFFDDEGFVFFTNYDSQKSRQMDKNPQVALLFPWLFIDRQIIVNGRVEKISTAKSAEYFATRARDSQLGAWASRQSEVLDSRKTLVRQFEKMREKFNNRPIPAPDFWGGYRVLPSAVEFWQGRKNRLHDRFVYRKNATGWMIERLSP